MLHSEVVSLGHPRAALLAFGVEALAYNTLAVLQSAVWSAHELHTSELEPSSFYFADEIRTHYAGMMMAVAPAAWERYDKLTAAQLARVLLRWPAMPIRRPYASIREVPGAKQRRASFPEPLYGAMSQQPACSRTDMLSNTFKAVTVRAYAKLR